MASVQHKWWAWTCCLAVVTGLALAGPVPAAEPPAAPRACRSVHLFYEAAPSAAFYNEVTIAKSAPGTYVAVCAWDRGYFGLQELGNGSKLLIFSVWDADPKRAEARGDAERGRVVMVRKDAQVRTGRFGGEGTGGQAFLDYGWKPDTTYRLLVRATVRGQRTEYAGYFFIPEAKAWKHLVTFSTVTGGKGLAGYYSFVEDFLRNGTSAARVREAQFGNGWILTAGGTWAPLSAARFTADDSPAATINAGLVGDRFFLATGGDTRQRGAQLQELLRLPPAPDARVPADLPP